MTPSTKPAVAAATAKHSQHDSIRRASKPSAKAVAQRARRKLSHGVCQAEDKDQVRQIEIPVMAGAGHHRHHHAEILAAEIIAGVEHP